VSKYRIIKKSDFDLVVLLKLYDAANLGHGELAQYQVIEAFECHVSSSRVQLSLDALYDENLIELRARNFNFYHITNKGLLRIESNLERPASILQLVIERGDEAAVGQNPIPASDRFVQIGHNQPPVPEIDEQLQIIETALATSNEAGDALGDDRPVIIEEVKSLRAALAPGRMRVQTILDAAKRLLPWLAEKSVSGAITEASKAAFKFIMSWLT
jgi:hypothetical protein